MITNDKNDRQAAAIEKRTESSDQRASSNNLQVVPGGDDFSSFSNMPTGSDDMMIELGAIMSKEDFYILFGDEAKVTCKLGQCDEKFEYRCNYDILHHLEVSHDEMCYERIRCLWRFDEHSSEPGGSVDGNTGPVCGKIFYYRDFVAHLADAHIPSPPFSTTSALDFAELSFRASRGQRRW